ncbi:hypothetical protein Esti_004677 [Eimeria stiedai]
MSLLVFANPLGLNAASEPASEAAQVPLVDRVVPAESSIPGSRNDDLTHSHEQGLPSERERRVWLVFVAPAILGLVFILVQRYRKLGREDVREARAGEGDGGQGEAPPTSASAADVGEFRRVFCSAHSCLFDMANLFVLTG